MLLIDPNSGIRPEQITELDLCVGYQRLAQANFLLHTEDRDAILGVLVNHRDGKRVGPAIVTFVRCRQSVFGYPSDKAQ